MIGALTVAFGEKNFIGACVDQFKDFPIRHLVSVSKYPWNGDAKQDDSAEVARKFGAEVVEGEWKDEGSQRNESLDMLSECDWIMIVDADEYYTKMSIRTILETLNNDTDDSHKTYESYSMETYWKSWDYAVRPHLYPPVIAVRPRVYPFNGIRSYNEQKYKMPKGVTTWHLSYVRTDEEIKRKITSWGHAHEVPDTWYKGKWLNWTPKTKDFNPTRPDIFHSVVELPVPDEIKDRIERTRNG